MDRYIVILIVLVGWSCNQAIKETQLSFQSENYTLNGTLTPSSEIGESPVAILVHGSGPFNRDLELPLIHEDQHCIYPELKDDTLRIFKDLAAQLSQEGIAVFRYDKRNYTYPGINNDADFSPYDLIADVHAAIDFVKTREHIDTNNIILIGHSQGANLIPIVAYERKDVQALIGMATPAIRIDTTALNQVKEAKKLCSDPSLWKEFDKVKKELRRAFEDSLGLDEPLLGWYKNYWDDWMKITESTIDNYNKVSMPLLFLWGTNDFNISFDHTSKLETKLDEEQSDIYHMGGLNHFFTTDTNPHIHPKVVEKIKEWLIMNDLLENGRK